MGLAPFNGKLTSLLRIFQNGIQQVPDGIGELGAVPFYHGIVPGIILHNGDFLPLKHRLSFQQHFF